MNKDIEQLAKEVAEQHGFKIPKGQGDASTPNEYDIAYSAALEMSKRMTESHVLVPKEPTDSELKKGNSYVDCDHYSWTAGINVGKWGHRIEVYGESQEEAEKFRDGILSKLKATGEGSNGIFRF